jgi:hypothetical protein
MSSFPQAAIGYQKHRLLQEAYPGIRPGQEMQTGYD